MTNWVPTPKYIINAEAELLGAAILALLQSQNIYDFQDLVAQYGYDQVKPDAWYSYPQVMKFLHDLTERYNQTDNMVSIGIKVFAVLTIPENVLTITDGLQMMNAMGDLTQRNIEPKRAWYTVEQIDERHIKFTDTSPLPHDLVYGEVYSLAHRLQPENLDFVITREYLNEAMPDEDGAIYHISLEP